MADYRTARKGDLIWHPPIITGNVIEGSPRCFNSDPDIEVAYVGAKVVCSIHPIPDNRIVTGAKNAYVKSIQGPDARMGADGSVCACGALVIASSENDFVEENSYG